MKNPNRRLLPFRGLATSILAVALLWTVSQTTAQTPTPTPDESVAWQNNPQHDGNDPSSPLVPPLTLKWKHDFTSAGVQSISYPLIAQGLVVVTTEASDFTKSLVAFNAATGQQVWSVNITGTYGFLNAAYDSRKVFAVNFDGLMQTFDAASGNPLWSVKLPFQYSFTSPPTAINGTVFVGGAGSGGTLYAVDENNGNVLWTAGVENGDHSSPAVIPGHVFVSYACPQAYSFAPATGQLQWHFSGPCEGGGGKTPVVHLGKVYVRDSFFTSTNGLILDANTGANLGSFASDRPPAFVGNLALYLSNQNLTGVDISSGQVLWSFAGDGRLTSAPLIANQTIYVGSGSGTLYGLDFQGHQIWSTQVGAPIQAPDEHNAFLTTGLGAGDGLLVVPAGAVLAVYGGAGSGPPIINSVTATPDTLWPPNKKMVPVSVTVDVKDDPEDVTCKIVSVTSNEPGDGEFQITGDLDVNLQAARNGSGNGRVYTIGIQCTNSSNNAANASVDVKVPHDRGN